MEGSDKEAFEPLFVACITRILIAMGGIAGTPPLITCVPNRQTCAYRYLTRGTKNGAACEKIVSINGMMQMPVVSGSSLEKCTYCTSLRYFRAGK